VHRDNTIQGKEAGPTIYNGKKGESLDEERPNAVKKGLMAGY